MRWTLAHKLFLALLLISLIILGLSAALTRWSFQRGFLDYVTAQESGKLDGLAERLASLYERDGGWEALRGDRRLWADTVRGGDPVLRGPEGGPPGFPPRHGPPAGGDPLEMLPRIVLLDGNGRPVIGNPDIREEGRTMAITLNGEAVGALRIAPPTGLTERVDLEFARRQSRSIYLVALVVLFFAAAASLLLARQLTRPIKSLADGARDMAAGRYEERITITANDELGELARDFNSLAATLASNRRARRQWLADISHELRTPLSILKGELQALEDGVRGFDAGTRRSLQAEAERLARLVDDLRELALSDEGGLSYRRVSMDLAACVRDALDGERSRIEEAGLKLERRVTEAALPVRADPARLRQLISNLVQNSLRYTEAPGVLRVSCAAKGDCAELEFADTPPGVPASALPQLFERLYRVDASRSRATGGTGLGLSICKAIVDAHDGEIRAESSGLGGLCVRVRLPLEHNEGARG